MLQPVSIRERILRRIADIADGIVGVGTVYRWDARASVTFQHGDVIVHGEDERSEPGAAGTFGSVRCFSDVTVSVVVFADADSAVSTEATINAWTKLLHDAYAADPLLSGGGTRLAVNAELSEIPAPDEVNGGCAAAVKLAVVYEHDGDDDSTYGTAITQLTQEEPA